MKRVLLVDDDQDIREALAELFEDSYQVLVASNGLMALDILSREQVDAVVLDLMMPLMDGETLLKELQEQGQKVPVVLLSASRDLARRASALGAHGYCAKPCSADKILAEVARVLAAPPGGGEPGRGGTPPETPAASSSPGIKASPLSGRKRLVASGERAGGRRPLQPPGLPSRDHEPCRGGGRAPEVQ